MLLFSNHSLQNLFLQKIPLILAPNIYGLWPYSYICSNTILIKAIGSYTGISVIKKKRKEGGKERNKEASKQRGWGKGETETPFSSE